ncbi:MAG: GNAT family N-acetyltransferase [Chloroflexota bacterium]|nr:GNAT family N-acetyltransferase [Chloroflexota bacterium]
MTIAADLIVRSERLDLPLLDAALLDALVAGDRATIAALTEYEIPDSFPDDEQREFLNFRRSQLANDPGRYPWSVRAIVRRTERRMVGFVNFHGAPGVNDTNTAGALELGWTVFRREQKRGYATETAIALMDWAERTYGVHHFISSTTPGNAASLRVHDKLGFARTGEFVEGEVIFQLRR